MRHFWLGTLLGGIVVGFPIPVLAAEDVSPEVIFKNRDINGDGRLSVDEYVGPAQGEAANKARARFPKLDKNSDGFLSFEEFATAPRFKK